MSYKKELALLAEEEGFDFTGERSGNGHYMLVCRKTGRKTFAPFSPRNAWRTLKNTRAQMRSTARCHK